MTTKGTGERREYETVEERMAALQAETNDIFKAYHENMERRFDQIEARFDRIEARIEWAIKWVMRFMWTTTIMVWVAVCVYVIDTLFVLFGGS